MVLDDELAEALEEAAEQEKGIGQRGNSHPGDPGDGDGDGDGDDGYDGGAGSG
ncbi:hypothetical protein AB0H88_19825 [Nonomuraea sp. NPDC050680]|uniref:hypothetical protein n=1 Tax=Nonomuraea sp. NPDC050680 TaxID=3154630 RepID=UPI00340B30B2